jgi:ABC-2 type transport system permease protein
MNLEPSFKIKILRVKALVIKEFFQIIRDPSSLIIATLFPLFLLFMYGYGLSLDVTKLRVGLISEDRSSQAETFICSLKDSPFFAVTASNDLSHVKQQLTRSDIDAIVWIPPYFSDYWQRAQGPHPTEQAPIFVATDGSSPNTATFAQNYVLAAWGNFRTQLAISSKNPQPTTVTIEPRFWFNEELNSHHFLIPGSIAIIITLIGTLLTALMISREWERGTMEALMATPVTIAEILWSKVIPYFFLGVISVTISVLVGHYLFEVPLRGSIIGLSLVSFFFLVVALGVGLLISSTCRDQFNAAQISLVTGFLPAFMLSGFMFEISSMPLWLRILTYMLPARYYVSSMQTLFLAGDVWSLIISTCLSLVIFAFILFFIIKLISKKRLD